MISTKSSKKNFFILFLVTILLAACSNESTHMEQLKQPLQQWQVNNNILVIEFHAESPSGKFNFQNGTTQLNSNNPITTSTLFGVGIITKTMVSIIALKLEDQEKLSLESTAVEFLPLYKNWKNITIRQPLNMIRGIPNVCDS
jgi:CubicO group peptidase (beta-lactamase class C family)